MLEGLEDGPLGEGVGAVVELGAELGLGEGDWFGLDAEGVDGGAGFAPPVVETDLGVGMKCGRDPSASLSNGAEFGFSVLCVRTTPHNFAPGLSPVRMSIVGKILGIVTQYW